jgi:large subunit ribosomal protein L29
MKFKNIKEIKLLNNEQIEKEIIIAKKQLFELRFKKATRQSFQPHSFVQLKYKLRLLLMFQENNQNFKETKHKTHTKEIMN